MMRAIVCLLLVLIWPATPVRADEKIRQAQEELRKRNLYFGNVDGQDSTELSGALKRHQTRKGFAVTGSVDDETAASLHIETTASSKGLPDLPVLRSDSASALPPDKRVALEEKGDENLDGPPPPPPPAESPGLAQNLTPERITKLVQDYLRDAETDDVPAQVKYFAFPLEYFPHGSVDEQFVTRDVSDYVKRWPERKYTLATPVSFFAAGNDETVVEFIIAFNVRSKARTTKNVASGRTKNWWTLRPEGDELRIVAIREQRLRE
jgi:Putative peptidoglycan binding domain